MPHLSGYVFIYGIYRYSVKAVFIKNVQQRSVNLTLQSPHLELMPYLNFETQEGHCEKEFTSVSKTSRQSLREYAIKKLSCSQELLLFS